MPLTISDIYFCGFEQVFSRKEMIYVKVSNISKWKFMLQIISFFL